MTNTKKTIDERINDLKQKQEQLKAQEKRLKAQKSQAERKARTKRLIEIGGAVESVLKKTLGDAAGIIQKDDIPILIDYLQGQEDRGRYFSNYIEKGRASNKKEKPTEGEQSADFGGLFE